MNSWLTMHLLAVCIRITVAILPMQAKAELPNEPLLALTTQQIISTFSDVRDDAVVKDADGTTAVNFWYADGRFVNRWRNNRASGTVTGRWSARNNQRCVLIESGLEGSIGHSKCGPVFKDGSRYISMNVDGSIHGVHTLSPLHN